MLQLLCFLLLLAAQSKAVKAMDQVKSFRSFINNHAIIIPSAFLSLNEGDHTITYDQQDIIVKVQRQSPNIIDTIFCIGEKNPLSESIIDLLLKVLLSSASKQNESKIEARTSEV